MSPDDVKEVSEMYNVSRGVYDKGVYRGIALSRKEGMDKGITLGRKEGMDKGQSLILCKPQI